MRLSEVQALLDGAFHGVEEGAARMYEPGEARFVERMSAVWLEYRWYVEGGGVAEVFVKWRRVEVERCGEEEVSVLRVHLMGKPGAGLVERAERVLRVGVPAPERLLNVFGEDGVRREVTAAGPTTITVEHWPAWGRGEEVLETGHFEELARVLREAEATGEERREAVEDLCREEQSARVVAALLAGVGVRPLVSALRRLSEWGVVEAQGAVERALGGLKPEEVADLWALTALQRRLQAWETAGRGLNS